MCLNIYIHNFLGKKVFWLKSLTFSNRTKCVDILMCSPYSAQFYYVYKTCIPDTRIYLHGTKSLYFNFPIPIVIEDICEMINDI